MRLLSYAIDKRTGIYTSDGRHQSEPPFLDFILDDSGDDTTQNFASLDEDIAGLLALLRLTPRELEKLVESERLNIPPYRLTYFPQKFFGIDKGNGVGRQYANISDMSQYDGSLDKIEDRHDTDYWFGKANKANQIAHQVYDVFVGLGLNPTSLISPKSVFEQRFKTFDLPTLRDLDPDCSEMSYNACMGNWVECYQRGRFEHTTDLDISSAYPSWASRLLDTRYGTWIRSKEYQPKAWYGYVNAEINIDSQFSPVLWKDREQANYTFTGVCEASVTKNTLDFITKYKLGFYTITDGFWWKPDKVIRPLQEPLRELYELKQQSTGLKKEIIKRIMSGGFYGNFLQTTGGQPGKHLFPPYGAEIETNTRLQVASFVIKNNLFDRLLAIAVDGLLINGIVNVPPDNQMGGWRKSYEGEAIVIHSGLNCIDGKFGEGDFSLSLQDLKNLINHDLSASQWVIHKPTVKTLGRAYNEHKLDTLGDIVPTSKTVFLNEFKRQYKLQPKDGNDVLTKQYIGSAWDIEMLKVFTETDSEEKDDTE